MRTIRTYLITGISIVAVSYAFYLSSATTNGRIFLDDVMSRTKQKNTGVYNLNHNQKLLLEDWINDTFVLKNAPPPMKPAMFTITENMSEGQAIKLSNGMIYEVSPEDVPVAMTWLFAFPISIQEGDDSDYPLQMTNMNTNVSINVRLKTRPMKDA
ncbi:MAG TPA: hypothetical protein VIJ46_06910 [Rhabdochlamydiaceae bacterium]